VFLIRVDSDEESIRYGGLTVLGSQVGGRIGRRKHNVSKCLERWNGMGLNCQAKRKKFYFCFVIKVEVEVK
jgi:hypothetical protein